jgi:hypothetical protein
MNEKDYLYIIVPYFNFSNFHTPKENLISFISNNHFSDKVRLIISEGIYRDNGLDIKSYKIFNHLKFKLKNILWVKENLINLAIKNLPNDWKYVLWCDKDILFENNDWVEKSIEKLKICDIIQPWTKTYLLKKNQKQIVNKNNLSYMTSILYFQKELINKKGHAGMVWGMNKNFYNKIGKILDWQILGQADLTFVFCCGLKDKNKLLLGENLLLGGYSNLKEFTDIFINQEYNEENILKFHNKYKLWNKKSILRLLEIINQK